VKRNPYITFHSTKIIQTSPDTFERQGWHGNDQGLRAINRKDYGLGGGTRFVAIADRLDVTIDFRATRVGPPLVFKKR